jgi:alanyl-tRNA synthetase
MLGNWSINRFWKEETIDMAFHYLVDCCGLNKDQIYATYFEGFSDDNITLPPDDETRIIWEKYLPANRIIPGSFDDNFWMMGDYGPCGNSTEIHYDLLGLLGRDNVAHLVNKDDPTVIEIWNNVFMEYNKDDTGYHKLDKHYVDTGMGLERLSMVLQNKQTIYQTDVFRSLFGYAQALSGGEFYTDSYDPDAPNFFNDVAYRIFVDHIRTTVVALYDGVEFGPNGREYVLRKIFRRLLTFTYLYLMDKTVSHIMDNQLVGSMVEYILAYFKKKISVDTFTEIVVKLITEEKGFIGKIRYIDRKINGYKKRYPDDKEEDIFNKIKESEGIPIELLQNKDSLRFV